MSYKSRNALEDYRRYSCSNIHFTRTSLCSSRKVEIPVENIVNQSKIEALEWQLKEIKKSREMYRAVMKQVVTFLEKAHQNLGLLGNQMDRRNSFHGSKNEHQTDYGRKSPDIPSPPPPQYSPRSTFDDHQLRELQWKQNKTEERVPEEIDPNKLAKEAFRLLRTAQSLLNTREPDLIQNEQPENDIDFLSQLAKEFTTSESIPQRATSFSSSPKLIMPENEMNPSTAFNRKFSLQLSDMRKNKKIYKNRYSVRNSVAESNSEFVSDQGIFYNQKNKSELSNSPTNGSISSIEDESGFSSMNSFQDVGLPLVNSTITEAVSTKNALLRSMLHNTDVTSEKINMESSRIWEKPPSSSSSTPLDRSFPTTNEKLENQVMKVLWTKNTVSGKYEKKCSFCGYKHAKGKCFTCGKVCNECNGRNNFASVCKKKGKKVNEVVVKDSSEDDTDGDGFFVSSLMRSIDGVKSNSELFWSKQINIEGKPSGGVDSKRFYNSFQFVNNIPGDGNSSEDDIASDSDSDYFPPLRYVSKNKNIEVISETDSETGDNIPSTSSSTQKPKRKSVKNNNLQEESKSKQSMPKKDKIIWTEKKLKEYDADKFSFLGETGLPACFDTLESPVDFFSLLFPDDLLMMMIYWI
ncbi:hypothetical protein JTB14_017313 [Gonioctena quinquepunctata]|nr:hypothetical protein JTB14_017313 [Gonioctena quinquepunctata]